jgi:hypothetical protein
MTNQNSPAGWSRNATQKSSVDNVGPLMRAGRSQNVDTAGFASSMSQQRQVS